MKRTTSWKLPSGETLYFYWYTDEHMREINDFVITKFRIVNKKGILNFL